MNHLNQWENSIRQGLEHHEAVPPVMGWEKLEQTLQSMEAAGAASGKDPSSEPSETAVPKKAGSHFAPSWVKGTLATMGVAAAASVAVVLLLHGPQTVDRTVPVLQQAERVAEQTVGAGHRTLAYSSERDEAPQTRTAVRTLSPRSSASVPYRESVGENALGLSIGAETEALACLSETEGQGQPCASAEESHSAPSVAAQDSDGRAEESKARVSRSPRNGYAPQLLSTQRKVVDYPAGNSAPHVKLKPRFALHMNASGARRMSQRGTYYNPPRLPLSGNVIVMGMPHEDFVYIVGANMDRSVQSTIHHKKPFQTGLSVSLPVSNRWSLRTGLTYTCLSTDIQAGSDVAYYVTEQSLHYVGVPLSAAYSIYGSRYFDCYASAGAMLEKCVKSKRSTSFNNMEQQRTADTRTSGFADGLWQASANVSVGVQLNITPQVGLYFEPGVSYFIPDGSSLPNVRHEHPWNFNMQGGLRLSLVK